MALKQKEHPLLPSEIEDKLFLLELRPNTEPHINVNQDVCINCKGKECTKFCPANVFHWSEIDDTLLVGYENCLECGACKIGCPYGNIEYDNPRTGYGVWYSS